MAKTRSCAHWIVPTTLIVSFAAGIALAAGHHYFYSTLHELPVAEARWSQDINNSIGTAFAFLVRATLVIAISTAFWQVFWRRLRRPLPLSTIDDLSSQLRVLYQLLNFKALKASPLLSGLALVAWLIPLAVVFPPATLKVVSASVPSHQMQTFQVPNYTNSEGFVASSMDFPRKRGVLVKRPGMSAPAPEVGWVSWDGPSAQVRRSLLGTGYQGQLPTFTFPGANSSYQLNFQGPSIECERMANETQVLAGLVQAGALCINGSDACAGTGARLSTSRSETLFLSWVPNGNGTVWSVNNTSLVGGKAEPAAIGTYPSQPQAIYFAYRDNIATKGWNSGNATALNCSLFNSTYNVSFTSSNRGQDVKVDGVEAINAITIRTPPAGQVSGRLSFPDFLAANEPKVLSHLAHMQVFGELLVGALYTETIHRTDSTHVLQTDLAFTHELHPIYVNYTSKKGADGSAALKDLRPLKETLEELFQNMTLSLLNVPTLLAPQPEKVQVSLTQTYNMYQYNWQRLWAAYGASIAATLLAVGIGIFSLIKTGASYSNNFSTVVRVSRDESLSVVVRDQDRFGQEPLPKYLGNATLVVQGGRSEESFGSHSSSTAYERVSLKTEDNAAREY